MARSRQPHPADDFNARLVADATSWSAFTQAGGRVTRHFTSCDEARQAAQVMADGFRRPALVYAIDAQGRTAVAETIQPSKQQESTMTKTTTPATFAKRFNAQRAARKALGADAQEGTHYRTTKVEGGFTWEAIAPEPAKAEAPEAAPAIKPSKPKRQDRAAGTSTGKRAAVEEAARQGQLPTPPDFSAATHARFRGKLAKLVAMVEAGDVGGLKAVAINPVSTSPRALARYRDLAVLAIEARKGSAAA